MSDLRRRLVSHRVAAFAAIVLLCAGSAARADCPALQAELGAAISSKSLAAAKATEKRIYLDDVCSARDEEAKRRIVDLEVAMIGDPALPAATRDTILADLGDPAGWLHGWTTAASLADTLSGQHRFAAASAFYDRAIALAGDPSAMTDAQKRDMIGKASAAKILASDDDEGRRAAQLATTTRGADGALGGIYAASMRSVVPVAVPLPINFDFASTTFTPVGEKAAAELGDYLKGQHIAAVTLIGHTDARGPDGYNVKLSQARVQKVADFLAKHGVAVHVTAVGKGWHDPLDVSRLPFTPDQEETWALNRRVDLLR